MARWQRGSSPERGPNVDHLGAFLGHFHPVLVHLPIGILLLLGALELAGLLSRARAFAWLPALTGGQRTLILALGACSSIIVAALGWLLAHGGDYDSALVHRHQLLGICAACACLAALAVHRWGSLYALALASSLALVVMAGHAGGKITHGSDYLTSRMPPALARVLGIAPPPEARKAAVGFERAVVFADAVGPILRDRCASCHGPAKGNGGLRLDSWELLSKGGKHGPVIKPGDLAASPLVLRIDLPSDAKEHMPPRGKPQLSDDELTVLEWWVGAGAPRDGAVAGLDLPPIVAGILEERLGGEATPPPDRAATLAQAARVAGELGIIVRPLSPVGPWIEVNARPAGRAFGDRELGLLAPVAPAIRWLDLGGTSVTDDGLAALAAMHGLERLHLDQTRIADPGLVRLSSLRQMEYLNLRGTAVTDAGMGALRALPRLRSLYLWQTAVTPAASRALGEALVDKRRIARWKSEQAELGRRIGAERFEGNTGESLNLDTKPAEAAAAGPASPPKVN